MRLVTFSVLGEQPRVGMMRDGLVYPIGSPGTSIIDLLPDLDNLHTKAGAEPQRDVSILAPIPRPPKILCLAGNYQEHVIESGMERAAKRDITPRVFLKPSSCITGPSSDILLPRTSTQVDWELELGVVIGRKGKYIRAADAINYIAGYVIFNDVSARSLTFAAQRKTRDWDEFFDWSNGKWLDGFGIMGPYLVTKDEVPDPHNLKITLCVNSEKKQNGNTNQMIFDIPETIEFISQLVTLEPGDVIATGTPAGVGQASGVFLKHGDILTGEIGNLGRQVNHVKQEVPQ